MPDYTPIIKNVFSSDGLKKSLTILGLHQMARLKNAGKTLDLGIGLPKLFCPLSVFHALLIPRIPTYTTDARMTIRISLVSKVYTLKRCRQNKQTDVLCPEVNLLYQSE